MTAETYDLPADLSGFETQNLKDLRTRLENELHRRAEAERKDAEKLIVQLATAHEIDLSGLSSKAVRKGQKVYANPDNCLKTWNGVGRKPKWVVEALSSGKTLKDLLIPEK